MKRLWKTISLLLALCIVLTGVALAQEDKPVTLKWITAGDPLNTNGFTRVWEELNKLLMRDFNCTLEVEFLGWSDNKTLLALRYASDDTFDFTFMSPGRGYAELANKNALAELTEEKLMNLMPGTYEDVSDDFWDQTRIDGKIYMIPFNSPRWSTPIVGIRGDLREKYGLDPIEDMDDLINYIEVIAANEPTMEAIAGGSKTMSYFLDMPNAWAYVNGAIGVNYILGDKTGEVFCPVFTDEYLEAAKLMRDLAEKNAWAKDAIADLTAQDDKMENGMLAVYVENLTANEAMGLKFIASQPDWKLEMYDTVNAPKRIQSCLGNGTTFNRNSKNLDLAMQVVNKFYSDQEYNDLIMCGIKDYHWKDIGPGRYEDLNPGLEENERYSGASYASWCWVNQEVERTMGEHYEGYEEMFEHFTKLTASSPLDSFSLNSANVQNEIAALDAVEIEFQDAIACGMYEDVEAAVNEYRAALTAAGIETVLEECRKQLAVYLAE